MDTGLPAINHWSIAQKLLFRFFAAYFFFYIFPFPLGTIPYTDWAYTWYNYVWDPMVLWVGPHLLNIHYPISTVSTGSGDRTYDYVILFIVAVLAIIAAIIWTLADRKRKSYDTLLYWLTVYVRYYLAFTMMGYGFAKVIQTQFPFPPLNWLTQTYGQSSPMRLAWSFMGYSTAYNMFTGGAEVAGGFLLFFRKTTTFGTLILITVLSNVVMMNFCFDIPVKLYSSNLLLMAVFIVIPDVPRLVRFFFLNQPVPAVNVKPRFDKRWMKWSWLTVKVLLVILALYSNVNTNWESYKNIAGMQKGSLNGLYNVQLFVRNNDTLPPMATDTSRWQKLIIPFPHMANVKLMNDTVRGFFIKPDTAKKTILLTPRTDTSAKSQLLYFYPDSLHFVLKGKLQQDSVYIVMQKEDTRNFLLVNRGFHWINEVPYNR